jgi:hypothetical protein
LNGGSILQHEEVLWLEGKNLAEDVKIDRERLESLYQRALEALQLRIRKWIETIEGKCQIQCRKEGTSINEYYSHADDALREQEACLQRQCDLTLKKKNEARSYDAIAELDKEYMHLRNQLVRLKRNNQKKRAELSEAWYRDRIQLKERSKISVIVTLVNLAFIRISLQI